MSIILDGINVENFSRSRAVSESWSSPQTTRNVLLPSCFCLELVHVRSFEVRSCVNVVIFAQPVPKPTPLRGAGPIWNWNGPKVEQVQTSHWVETGKAEITSPI